MKKVLLVVIAPLLVCALFIFSFAHGGRTDSSGGHYNRSTGEYHYHHGYSAHSHYDIDGDGTIDCPYDFDDTTSQGSSRIERETETQKVYDPKDYFETTAQETETEAKESVARKSTKSFGNTILDMVKYILNKKISDIPVLLVFLGFFVFVGHIGAFFIVLIPVAFWNAFAKKPINEEKINKIFHIIVITISVISALGMLYEKVT